MRNLRTLVRMSLIDDLFTSFVYRHEATKTWFGCGHRNRLAMTASTTWAATQQEARCVCEPMLRQRSDENE